MTVASRQTMSIPEFSVHLGYSRTYGYQLAREGRLVMAADGKRVLVAESIQRVRETADPAKSGVAARHAAQRAAPALAEPAQAQAQAQAQAADEPAEQDEGTAGGYDYQIAKAKREHWAAERERTAHRREAGELIEVSEHVSVLAGAGATLRAALEAWSALLPPQLVGQDEGAIRATIADQVEQILGELSARIGEQAARLEAARP